MLAGGGRQAAFEIIRHTDRCGAAPPNGVRRDARGDAQGRNGQPEQGRKNRAQGEGDGKEKSTLEVLAHIKASPASRRHERANTSFAKRHRVPGFIKGLDSQLVAGFVAFYNYIRWHLGLGGETPAAAAGIITGGANPWATLIKNAYWHACA